jgi:hypothetical protein
MYKKTKEVSKNFWRSLGTKREINQSNKTAERGFGQTGNCTPLFQYFHESGLVKMLVIGGPSLMDFDASGLLI